MSDEKIFELDDETRKKYLNLLFCGCSVEMAAKKFTAYTYAEYNKVKKSREFMDWRDDFIRSFNNFLDGYLLGRIFTLGDHLDKMNPIEHPNYHRVHGELIRLLDRTAPIAERMRKSMETGGDAKYNEDEIEIVKPDGDSKA